MKVFIANFGRENYAWPNFLARRTVGSLKFFKVQSERQSCQKFHTFDWRTALGLGSWIRGAARRDLLSLRLFAILARLDEEVFVFCILLN